MIMLLYDHLIKVFNPTLFDIRYGGGIFNLEETEKNATVKQIELEYHGQLMTISNSIFNKTDFLFLEDEKVDPELPKLQHGCDGVLVVEVKGNKYLIFIELKSDYTPDNISKAEKQICASYLRISMLLNGIRDIDLKDYKKCGIIVSHPLNAERMTKLQKKKNTHPEQLSRYDKQCFAFINNKSFPLRREYARLYKLPIKDFMFFDELPTFHFRVNAESTQGKFKLEDVLKQL